MQDALQAQIPKSRVQALVRMIKVSLPYTANSYSRALEFQGFTSLDNIAKVFICKLTSEEIALCSHKNHGHKGKWQYLQVVKLTVWKQLHKALFELFLSKYFFSFYGNNFASDGNGFYQRIAFQGCGSWERHQPLSHSPCTARAGRALGQGGTGLGFTPQDRGWGAQAPRRGPRGTSAVPSVLERTQRSPESWAGWEMSRDNPEQPWALSWEGPTNSQHQSQCSQGIPAPTETWQHVVSVPFPAFLREIQPDIHPTISEMAMPSQTPHTDLSPPSSPYNFFFHRPISPELTMTLSGQEDSLQSTHMLQHPTVNIHYILPTANGFCELQDPKTGWKWYRKTVEGKA